MKKIFVIFAVGISSIVCAGNNVQGDPVVYFNEHSAYYHLSTSCALLESGKLYLSHEKVTSQDHVICPNCSLHRSFADLKNK